MQTDTWRQNKNQTGRNAPLNALTARFTQPQPQVYLLMQFYISLKQEHAPGILTHKVGALITECTFISSPSWPLPFQCRVQWREPFHISTPRFPRQRSASFGAKLPSEGCGKCRGLGGDVPAAAKNKVAAPHISSFFSVGVLLLDCWWCCGLGLCGPRQQTLSHPGRGPRWTCSCCWHEGKDETRKQP